MMAKTEIIDMIGRRKTMQNLPLASPTRDGNYQRTPRPRTGSDITINRAEL